MLVMERRVWTDERIDERMTAIETTFARIFEELAAIRSEFRSEIGGLRTDLSAWQGQIAQIGWALVGTLGAALVAGLVALVIALA